MAQYKIEALWDCVYCGSMGIGGSKGSCPNCGNPRGAEVRFYLPNEIGKSGAVDESEHKISEGPDWLCYYCKRYNRSELDKCRHCGAKRTDENPDYFQIGRKSK